MYIYTGKNGEHLMHVPDRDLSAEEFAALTPELQEAVKAAPFYEIEAKPAPKPPTPPKVVPPAAPKDEVKA